MYAIGDSIGLTVWQRGWRSRRNQYRRSFGRASAAFWWRCALGVAIQAAAGRLCVELLPCRAYAVPAARFAGENFVEFASQGFQCSAAHVAYVHEKGGRIHWLKDIDADPVGRFKGVLAELKTRAKHIFISFDLDSVRGCDAPVRLVSFQRNR